MALRRGWGEGSVYFDASKSRWFATAEGDRDPLTGKRTRVKVRGKTKAEAMRRLREAQQKIDAGVHTVGGSQTVSAFLEHWLTTVVAGRVGERTHDSYERIVRKHLSPALGHIRLERLTPEDVDRMLAAKAATGLSRTYITRMRIVLADALKHAQRRGLVVRNAGALAVMPRTAAPTPRRSLNVEELQRFIEAVQGERLESFVILGLAVGMRPGELAGLLWTDLDLDGRPPTLSVSGSMKYADGGKVVGRGDVKRSAAGRRTIALPPHAVKALHEQRRRQDAERDAAGADWEEHGLVFPSRVGTPLNPNNLRRDFRRFGQRAGIEGSVPYLLRHTAASLMIDRGAGIEQVADVLGDDPRTLLLAYRHRVRPVADAALVMQDVLNGGRKDSTSAES